MFKRLVRYINDGTFEVTNMALSFHEDDIKRWKAEKKQLTLVHKYSIKGTGKFSGKTYYYYINKELDTLVCYRRDMFEIYEDGKFYNLQVYYAIKGLSKELLEDYGNVEVVRAICYDNLCKADEDLPRTLVDGLYEALDKLKEFYEEV